MNERTRAFSEKLRNGMRNDGMGITRFARYIGVSESALRAYMRGDAIPKPEVLNRIAHFLRCDPDWLYECPGDLEQGWKRCDEYEDYELNTRGQIRNIKTGKILKTSINEKGYERVTLQKDGKPHTKNVHRLMGDVFMDVPEGMDIYHENMNRSDNRLENLRYGTRSYISKRGFEKGNRHGRGHIPVRIENTKNPDDIKEFDSIKECARYLEVSDSAVSKCTNGITMSCKGYKIYLLNKRI